MQYIEAFYLVLNKKNREEKSLTTAVTLIPSKKNGETNYHFTKISYEI